MSGVKGGILAMGEEVLTRLMSMTNVVCHANMDNLINVMVSGLVKC